MNDWQNLSDQAQFTELGSSLPNEAPIGTREIEPHPSGDREWLYVEIMYGRGQWAYWTNRDNHQVCADVLFNDKAAQFAGFLARAHYSPARASGWVLLNPRFRPPAEIRIPVEPIEQREGRYERNDVDRIERPEKPNAEKPRE